MPGLGAGAGAGEWVRPDLVLKSWASGGRVGNRARGWCFVRVGLEVSAAEWVPLDFAGGSISRFGLPCGLERKLAGADDGAGAGADCGLRVLVVVEWKEEGKMRERAIDFA